MTNENPRLAWRPLALIAGLAFAGALGAGLAGCGSETPPARTYQCPMHPAFTSDQPGDCSICGMDLVPVAPSPAAGPAGAAAGSAGERRVLFYRNPMNPEVTSTGPAKDEMGMDFIPVYSDEAAAAAGAVAGLAPVMVSSAGLELAGIQTAPARQGSISREVRAVGRVTADETRVRHVHTKIAGWVEKLHVNFTGQFVRAGQPLLAIYSPELLASQEELLGARTTAARFADSSLPEVRRGGGELVAAARRRLELYDVPAAFIDRLLASGQVQRTVPLAAPVTGFVTSKQISEGQQVGPEMDLFTITDLGRVWIEADLYEYEAASVALGQTAVIELPHDSGRQLAGRVAYVYPYLDPASRTLKVRFEFDNPDLALKPEMFVDVRLRSAAAEGVVVPDSAVMDSGLRRVVFVRTGAGRFEPREVKVGLRSGGEALILAGVEAGEQVVVGGNFLLDSESRLRAALAGAGMPAAAAPGPPPAGPAEPAMPGHDHSGGGGS